jgi:hypothetical protein
MDGATLKAFCRKTDGREELTELHDAARCPDVVNNNGFLQCRVPPAQPGYGESAGPAPGYGGPPPYREGWRQGSGDERREHCDHLRHRAYEIRERLGYNLPPYEREELERRLSDTRQEFRSSCGEWRD